MMRLPLMCAYIQVYKWKSICSTVQLQSEVFFPPPLSRAVSPDFHFMHGGGGTHSHTALSDPLPVLLHLSPTPPELGQAIRAPPLPHRTGNWGNGPSNGSLPKETGAFDGRVQWSLFSQDEDETEKKHRAGIVLTSNLLFFVTSSVFLSL